MMDFQVKRLLILFFSLIFSILAHLFTFWVCSANKLQRKGDFDNTPSDVVFCRKSSQKKNPYPSIFNKGNNICKDYQIILILGYFEHISYPNFVADGSYGALTIARCLRSQARSDLKLRAESGSIFSIFL